MSNGPQFRPIPREAYEAGLVRQVPTERPPPAPPPAPPVAAAPPPPAPDPPAPRPPIAAQAAPVPPRKTPRRRTLRISDPPHSLALHDVDPAELARSLGIE